MSNLVSKQPSSDNLVDLLRLAANYLERSETYRDKAPWSRLALDTLEAVVAELRERQKGGANRQQT